jgi:4-amino-4-deoxychorismate lyase
MIGRRLVNGVEGAGIAADDRGLQYGDGLFETMAAVDGRVRHLQLHLARLLEGCSRLGIPPPAVDAILADCDRVLEGLGDATVKLVVTRGPSARGYAPPEDPNVTRIVTAGSSHTHDLEAQRPLVTVICRTRLALNERLAGIKHLNRLEQVLAASELRELGVDEGLMLAMDGRLICATAANVFLVRSGRLLTPAIHDCGVAGIMRQVVLHTADELGLPSSVLDLEVEDLASADEVFVTNAVRGLRPVIAVAGIGRFEPGEVTRRLRERLASSGGA